MSERGPSLLALLGGVFRRVASTDGGEWAGACPWCGGTDRFRVWPERERPGWWCRGCERHGDAITFLREYHGMSFREAAAAVGRAGSSPRARARRVGRRSVALAPRLADEREPPPDAWQTVARRCIAWAEKLLWGAAGAPVRAYLQARGLTEVTIREARLGYCPRDVYWTPEHWGLPAGPEARKVWLPRGLLIPDEDDGRVWYLKVRRAVPADDPLAAVIGAGDERFGKYVHVRGSVPTLYRGAQLVGAALVVLTEGELDALLLAEYAEGLAAVGTLGAAGTLLTAGDAWRLRSARRVLLAYDADAAGENATHALSALSGRLRVVRPLGAKDLTAMHQAGGDLAAWLRAVVARHGVPEASAMPERTAPSVSVHRACRID